MSFNATHYTVKTRIVLGDWPMCGANNTAAVKSIHHTKREGKQWSILPRG